MDEREVDETLEVIRRLMERGTSYEAITAQGALLAGGLASVAGLAFGLARLGDAAFLAAWAGVAAVSSAWIVGRALKHGEEPGLTPQARAVGRAVLPALLAALALSGILAAVHQVALLPAAWLLLHGVAILSTQAHAPERLTRLGWAFLLAGVVAAPLLVMAPLARDACMGLGFGGLNLLYGLLARARD